LAAERLRGGREARVGSGGSGQRRGGIGRGQQRLEGGHQLVSGEVLELREHLDLEKLAILRLVVDGEGRGAQLVREAPVAGRAAVRGARVEDGVAASDVPDRRRESWFGGEPFVGRQRR